ncbi:TITAN-like protein [Actinidia chinensis var. chinensis]|uniref:TITAN-like protein n=1 Tax=Actinidia chinensis var. chinensis TaxID=1590841 RepID=A0A2R6PUJ6_ACTCC|nr:TITAN-like protein [Actinidia chinensis var. chinensis]
MVAKSLSSSSSHFQSKPSDLKFFLKNPSLLCHEHASRNRLWCVFCDSGLDEAHPDERMVNRESSSQGLKNLTQISAIVQQETKGNVHCGAPPPWLDATEGNILNVRPKPASSLNKSGKSQKLNPKRVGAAWAEKRKRELELEKRGEIVPNNFDANWLPNFGRVWQSGSRKESRKEFVVENKNSLTGETQSETLNDIQPYVSKRMRTDVGK